MKVALVLVLVVVYQVEVPTIERRSRAGELGTAQLVEECPLSGVMKTDAVKQRVIAKVPAQASRRQAVRIPPAVFTAGKYK
jgi:hypothetical protein